MPLDYNYTGTEQSLAISEVTGLQTALDLKADQTSISNIDNTSDANKPVSTAQQTALDLKADQTSISNMDNTSDANKPVSTAQQTALDLKADQTSISNMDNTSDADKPVSNATQTALDLKSNLASPTFSGTVKIEKADNYGQIELTDLKSVATGVGGGLTMKGVYGGSGQTTGLAHIKAKKSNATVGDYHGDLSLSVREHGGGGYTEIIKLKGEDLKTIVSGAMEVAGNINLPTGSEFQINGTAIGGGGGGGVCLESIQELCKGQSITTVNGDTLTLPNITAVIKPAQTGGHTILASIDYEPPSGTKSVMLTLKMFIGWNGNNGSCNALFDCRVNSTSYFGGVISSQSFIRSNTGMGEVGEYSINCLMNVDSSIGADDLPNGKIKTWNTPYTFNFASSRTIQNSEVFLCSNNPHPYNTATDKFIVPMIIIKAFS